jgi:hypothetical protein
MTTERPPGFLGQTKPPGRLRRFFASPWIAAVLAVGAPVAGFWVATQSQAIQAAAAQLSWLQPPAWTLLGIPGAFWVLVGVIAGLGVLWVFHKYADSSFINARQDAVVGMFQEATRLGLSRGLNQFRDFVERAHYAFLVASSLAGNRDLNRAKRRELYAESIRQVLGYMALLAHELDGAPGGSGYSAALYVWHRSERIGALPQAEREALFSPDRFVFFNELSCELNQIAGVLEMRRELSTRAIDQRFGPDPSNPELVLPVPRPGTGFTTIDGRERWIGLPGAPYTAATQDPAAFESIEAMMTWVDEHADLSGAVRRRLSELFEINPGAPDGGRGRARSFLTLPVVLPSPLEAKPESRDAAPRGLVGVVTIQSDAPGLLAGHRYEVFANVGTPFLLYLSSLTIGYLAA